MSVLRIGWEAEVRSPEYLISIKPPVNYKDEDKKRAYVDEAEARRAERLLRIPLVSKLSRVCYSLPGSVYRDFQYSPGSESLAAKLCQDLVVAGVDLRTCPIFCFGVSDFCAILAAELATLPPEQRSSPVNFYAKGGSPRGWLLRRDTPGLNFDPYDIIPEHRHIDVSREKVYQAYSQAVGASIQTDTAAKQHASLLALSFLCGF